jgi:serine/threonine-protein kinase
MLSKVTVEVVPEARAIADLRVAIDGREVGRSAWGIAIPTDPGAHSVEASAPGYARWTRTVTLGKASDSRRVTVPALVSTAAEGGEETSGGAASGRREPAIDTPRAGGSRTSGSALHTWGIVSGAAGLAAFGVGGYFGLRAMSKNDDSKADCTGDVCGRAGKTARDDARSAGNLATVGVAVGAVLVGVGVTLFVVGGQKESVRLRIGLERGGASTRVAVSF